MSITVAEMMIDVDIIKAKLKELDLPEYELLEVNEQINNALDEAVNELNDEGFMETIMQIDEEYFNGDALGTQRLDLKSPNINKFCLQDLYGLAFKNV